MLNLERGDSSSKEMKKYCYYYCYYYLLTSVNVLFN